MSTRKEVWLYERIEVTGEIGTHLYAVLSDEHPLGAAGALLAEFPEDVYTEGRAWRHLGQVEAMTNLAQGRYTYVNFSKRMIDQEWDRPVFAMRKSGIQGKENFIWQCFKRQLAQHLRQQKQQTISAGGTR